MNRLENKKHLLVRIIEWVKSNRFEALLLTIILFLSAYLRIYRIADYMTFLGDEGRDAIVVRRLLVNLDLILVGPGTSIGNMYLGPLYYYLIAPSLLIFNFSPVGPSVFIALIGILTVFFVWLVAREWFGKFAAFTAALLYATSPVVITYSRSSWNPNIMPFFALLSLYSIWKVYKDLKPGWLLVLAISLAFVLNSHYLGLLLIPPLVIYWLLGMVRFKKEKGDVGEYVKKSIISLFLFLTLMSPLVVFDARHGWRNLEALNKFFTVRQETISVRPWNALPKFIPLVEKISTRLIFATDEKVSKNWNKVFLLLLSIVIFSNMLLIYKKRNDLFKSFGLQPDVLVGLWLVTALVGLGVYKQEIYDHYFGFIFPASFLFIGSIFQKIYNKNWVAGALIIFPFTIYLFINNLQNSPLKYPPNRQLNRSISIANETLALSEGREFNFAVIAERNYEGAYQYFFEKDGAPFVIIDPQRTNETIKDQLFVVCELPIKKCDPTHNSKAEIANFGWSKIEFQKEFEGVTIFKLVHY